MPDDSPTLTRVESGRRQTPYSREDSYDRHSPKKPDFTRTPTPHPHRASRNTDESGWSTRQSLPASLSETGFDPESAHFTHAATIRFASLPGPDEYFSYPAERDPTRSELYLEKFEAVCGCCFIFQRRKEHALSADLDVDRPRIISDPDRPRKVAQKASPPKGILKHDAPGPLLRAPTGIC